MWSGTEEFSQAGVKCLFVMFNSPFTHFAWCFMILADTMEFTQLLNLTSATWCTETCTSCFSNKFLDGTVCISAASQVWEWGVLSWNIDCRECLNLKIWGASDSVFRGQVPKIQSKFGGRTLEVYKSSRDLDLDQGRYLCNLAFARTANVALRQSNLPYWKVQVTTWQKVHLQLFGLAVSLSGWLHTMSIHQPC